uniref:Putative 8-amino-7-oxononanoate synthase n=2 Tax=Neisseria leonii TaxID=2995413 RepID=A0A9X4IB12_9NEIS|nr:8-amino-7-oxononanoate synthase [Neisseria sp. 51.81]MDD9327955.1 8-amino-7-oxononanoate synthase [Neisseria sp. 51.81]
MTAHNPALQALSDGLSARMAAWRETGMLRTLPQMQPCGRYVLDGGRKLLNLSANDYLGLAADEDLRRQFLHTLSEQEYVFGSSSSRLLGGNHPVFDRLEHLIAARYGREACLLFNSGYHANSGILPALADRDTLMVADKRVHASLIDGMRLARAQNGAAFCRFPHQDYARLAEILHGRGRHFARVLVVTESIFSMDGDCTDLRALVDLKRHFDNVLLYVDEAHAVGVRGSGGLGLAQEQDCIGGIDFLVGTFGKALAASGAYLVCGRVVKDWLVNTARPLLFSTALPPVAAEWAAFVFARLPQFEDRRRHLAALSHRFQTASAGLPGTVAATDSHLVPYVLGDPARAQACAHRLRAAGFYCLPVRPPTVPPGRAGVRFSLNAAMTEAELDALAAALGSLSDAD